MTSVASPGEPGKGRDLSRLVPILCPGGCQRRHLDVCLLSESSMIVVVCEMCRWQLHADLDRTTESPLRARPFSRGDPAPMQPFTPGSGAAPEPAAATCSAADHANVCAAHGCEDCQWCQS